MAATKGNMTLRMEPELKAQAAALFKSLGMEQVFSIGRRSGVMVCLLK